MLQNLPFLRLRGRLFRLLPLIRQQPRETPVLFSDFLNDDMSMFGLLAKDPNQRICDVLYQFSFLLVRSACCDLYVDVWDLISKKCVQNLRFLRRPMATTQLVNASGMSTRPDRADCRPLSSVSVTLVAEQYRRGPRLSQSLPFAEHCGRLKQYSVSRSAGGRCVACGGVSIQAVRSPPSGWASEPVLNRRPDRLPRDQDQGRNNRARYSRP